MRYKYPSHLLQQWPFKITFKFYFCYPINYIPRLYLSIKLLAVTLHITLSFCLLHIFSFTLKSITVIYIIYIYIFALCKIINYIYIYGVLQLGDAGAVSLSEMFAGNNKANIPLETLGIGVNNIGGIGATALANQLGECTNCPLKTLGL